MKLTKKLEAEIKRFMNSYWDTYLKGDLKTWGAFLPADYKNIGGTEEEIWNSKKEILDYTKRVINQMVGQVEIRNKKTQIIPYDPYFMVHEFADMFIKVDKKWTFYGKFRLSSIIQKTAGGWKVLHQHGSYPDSKTTEGEAFAFDTLKSENKKLLEAVKSRTAELENKNRELEIETALEKVRTIAMGMRKPEDFPDVCEVLFKELQLLGFNELRNAMVNIHNDEKRSFVNYDYSDEIGKSITPLFYNEHPVIKKQVKQIRKADDSFSESVFKGKDLEDWKIFRKSRGEKNDKRIKNIKALYYYFYSIGTGSIGISTFDKISEEKKDVLKRFRNVFAFAYRRYMDVAQAEAQAREAQIELALERVRAKTMAMQKPSEFVDLVSVIGQQFVRLGFDIEWANFGANGHDISNGIDICNFAVIPGMYHSSERLHIPYIDHPVFTIAAAGIKKYQNTGEDFFVIDLDKKEKDRWMKHMYTRSEFQEMPDEFKKIQYNKPGYKSSVIVLN